MKKNDMLNESTIRRFMKLATIGGLSDKFVTENLSEEEDLEEGYGKDDEEEMAEGYGKEDEEAMDEVALDEEEEEMEMDMEMGAEEEPMDMAAEEPAAGGAMVSVDQLMSALERALEDVLGQEVEVSQDGEEEMGAEEEPMEMDMDMEMGAEEEGGEEEAGEEMEAEEEEEELAEVNADVIEEVFARVIQRLQKETKSK